MLPTPPRRTLEGREEMAMVHIRTSIMIRRSQEETFDYLTDVRNAKEWSVELVDVDYDGDLREGSTGVDTRRVGRKQTSMPWVVTGYERPERIVFEYGYGGGHGIDTAAAGGEYRMAGGQGRRDAIPIGALFGGGHFRALDHAGTAMHDEQKRSRLDAGRSRLAFGRGPGVGRVRGHARSLTGMPPCSNGCYPRATIPIQYCVLPVVSTS